MYLLCRCQEDYILFSWSTALLPMSNTYNLRLGLVILCLYRVCNVIVPVLDGFGVLINAHHTCMQERSRPERLDPKPYLRIMQRIDTKVCMSQFSTTSICHS